MTIQKSSSVWEVIQKIVDKADALGLPSREYRNFSQFVEAHIEALYSMAEANAMDKSDGTS